MKPYQLTAGIVVLLGVLALAYGGFTYTKDTHETSLGPLNLSVQDNERVNLPAWAGASCIVIGGFIFFFGRGRR